MAVVKDSRLAMRLSRSRTRSSGTRPRWRHQHHEVHRRRGNEPAINVMAGRRVFAIDDAAWGEFVTVLDRPVSHKSRLGKLLAEPLLLTEA